MSESHGESLGSIILHHVTNDLGYKFLDLHLLGYDISITKHVVMLWIAAVITVALAIYGTQRYRKSENSISDFRFQISIFRFPISKLCFRKIFST